MRSRGKMKKSGGSFNATTGAASGQPAPKRVNPNVLTSGTKHSIARAVGMLHVGTSDADVEKSIRGRITRGGNVGAHPTLIKNAVKHAIKVHGQNRDLYKKVMGGSFSAKTKFKSDTRAGAVLGNAGLRNPIVDVMRPKSKYIPQTTVAHSRGIPRGISPTVPSKNAFERGPAANRDPKFERGSAPKVDSHFSRSFSSQTPLRFSISPDGKKFVPKKSLSTVARNKQIAARKSASRKKAGKYVSMEQRGRNADKEMDRAYDKKHGTRNRASKR
jgi:hypothetical protein